MSTEEQHKPEQPDANGAQGGLRSSNASPKEKPPDNQAEHTGYQKPNLFGRVKDWLRSYRVKEGVKNGMAWIEIVALITLVFYTHYACQQAGAAIDAANAAKRAADIAACALKSSDDSFKKTLKQMQAQTAAQGRAADAAKGAADTAKTALHISERAYVSVTSAEIDLDKIVISLHLSNGGRIPSGRGEAVIHNRTIERGASGDNWIEYGWKRFHLPSFPPNNTSFSIDIPFPAASKASLEDGHQILVAAGKITYGDGFPDDSPGQWMVCFSTTWHLIEKRMLLVPCNPETEIPMMEKVDGYPNDEQK